MSTLSLLGSIWKWDPIAAAACLAAAATYLVVERKRLGARVGYFAAALLACAVALLSPVGTLADGYLFSAHMLQHLLLVLVVPPLALLGLSGDVKRGPGRALGRRAWVVCWAMGVGAMWLWHAPTLCNAAAQNGLVHRAQEVSLVAMGTAFWWPILSPRGGARIAPLAGVVYLFSGCIACTILGIAVTFSPVEVCSIYLHPADPLGLLPTLRGGWGLTPEKDQQLGGLLMWVPACLVYGVAIMAMLARLYRGDEAGVDRRRPERA
jgi:cytochrome c oxidase assembly factor CtaG